MIITLICLIITFIGLILLLIDERNEILEVVNQLLLIIGMGGILICSLCILSSHTRTDLKIEKDDSYREALVWELRTVNNDKHYFHSKIDVIDRIAAYNSSVIEYKYKTNSPWTSWFYDKKYADTLEIIDVEGEK